jgi:hypothetical protein
MKKRTREFYVYDMVDDVTNRVVKSCEVLKDKGRYVGQETQDVLDGFLATEFRKNLDEVVDDYKFMKYPDKKRVL